MFQSTPGVVGTPLRLLSTTRISSDLRMDEERPDIWFGMSTATTAFLFLLAFWFI